VSPVDDMKRYVMADSDKAGLEKRFIRQEIGNYYP